MIIHIVHAKETIYLIAEHYHVEVNDIISLNQHITDFRHIQPGTKIKIPLIAAETLEELEETEPFIEDYYPENYSQTESVEEEVLDVLEKQEEPTNDSPKAPRKVKYPYYYYKNRGLPYDF